MSDINYLIAQGPGKHDFSSLGEIFGAYREGVKARREDEMVAARRGLPAALGPDGQPDYGAASLHLLRSGDVNGASALAHVARAMAGRPGAQSFPALPRPTTRALDAVWKARQAHPGLMLNYPYVAGVPVADY